MILPKFPKFGIFTALLIAALLLSACSVSEAKGMKPSPDWSKGVPVADGAAGSMGFAVRPDGGALYLVYPYTAAEGVRLRYLQLDQDAAPVVDRELDLPIERLRSPRLLLAEGDQLHLFWGDRQGGGGWGIWYALLDQDGGLAGEPVRITPEEVDVAHFEAAPAGGGGAVVVWDSQRDPAIYGLEIEPSGQVEGDPVQIAQVGSAPSLAVGADGSIDIAWVDDEGIRAAHLPDGELAPAEGSLISPIATGTGDTVFGPVVGRSDGWVYVFWSLLSRSGLRSGQATTSFASYPAGADAGDSDAEVIPIIPLEKPPYGPYTGMFSLTQLVPGAGTPFRSAYVYEPNPIKSELGELAIGISTEQALRQDLVVQVATLLFEDGEFKGYTFSGKTPGFSSNPFPAADSEGNLYIAWRDGSAGEKIYLATTSPEMRASIDRIQAGDIVNTVLQGGIEGAATMLLFPLAIPWVVPGFILLGLWKVFRDYESLRARSSWVVLVIALVLYEVTKILFLPTVLEYVPFSAWIDIPQGLSSPLRIVFPLLSLGAGIALAELNRRRRSQSTLLYYTIVVFTDLLITLAVYGVAYLGVF
ncbi:MAG TPA: hypothetical protein VJ768_11255 [Anaerolineales bacterium]|nr:hypothetical protein [Anaerolineales bacterium]